MDIIDGFILNILLKIDARVRHFISNLNKRLLSHTTPATVTAICMANSTATREDAKNKPKGCYSIMFQRLTDDYYYYYCCYYYYCYYYT